MIEAKCSSEYRVTDPDEHLIASLDLTDWLQALPSDAALTAITVEHGPQRDPWSVTVGLRATWTEVR